MKQRFFTPLMRHILYGTALLGSVSFCLWLRQASADQPMLLLRPVVWLTGTLSGARFLFRAGVGFLGGGVVVEKSCAGGNFLVICFTLLVFTQLRRVRTAPALLVVFAGSLALSYAAAVAASACRITATLLLMGAGIGPGPVLLHNIIGMSTFVVTICLCYLAAQRLVPVLERKGEPDAN